MSNAGSMSDDEQEPTLTVADALRRIEVALGIRYPVSLHERVNELVALGGTTGFQRAFPATALLLDVEQVRRARKEVGGRLLPFMRSAAEHPDIYAFEPGAEGKVVVWCVHTTVREWADFAQFLSWVRETSTRSSSSSSSSD